LFVRFQELVQIINFLELLEIVYLRKVTIVKKLYLVLIDPNYVQEVKHFRGQEKRHYNLNFVFVTVLMYLFVYFF
jgi:hypothetical protein